MGALRGKDGIMRRIIYIVTALVVALTGLAGCASQDGMTSGKPMYPDRQERGGGGY